MLGLSYTTRCLAQARITCYSHYNYWHLVLSISDQIAASFLILNAMAMRGTIWRCGRAEIAKLLPRGKTLTICANHDIIRVDSRVQIPTSCFETRASTVSMLSASCTNKDSELDEKYPCITWCYKRLDNVGTLGKKWIGPKE